MTLSPAAFPDSKAGSASEEHRHENIGCWATCQVEEKAVLLVVYPLYLIQYPPRGFQLG